MGRDSSDRSDSPVRNRGSSRRSPYRGERSPAPRRSSHSTRSPGREKPSSRTKPLKRAKSPVNHSPVRGKPSCHTRSPKYTRSRSPSADLPVKEKPSGRTKSPMRAGSRSPSLRSKRLRRAHADSKADKLSDREHEKNHSKTRSPESRSPSPWSRRLRRAQADDEAEEISDRGHERNCSREGERATHKERDLEKEVRSEKRDRRSGRDTEHNGSYNSRHASSTSPADHHRNRHRSRSPLPATRARDETKKSRGGNHRNDDDDDSVAQMRAAEEALATKEKQKPSFELSGKLAAETNRVKGVTLLFTEPPDAQKPDIRWRFYVFKGGEALNEPLYVHCQSCYLFGRERRVADIPTDHPSCSKQHAVLQYRQVEKEQPDGMLAKQVRPYLMDLGSTNGTFVNDNRIEPQRYYELMEKDTIKFGNSSREYVLLHENSAG